MVSKYEPLLVTGTFRSGTTLTGRVVNNHKLISCSIDTVCYLRFCYNDEILNEGSTLKILNEISRRINARWKISFDINKVLEDIDDKYEHKVIWDSVMSELYLSEKKKIWGEKIVLEWNNIPAFFEMYPTGRVIHTIRDPRSVLVSWKKMTKAPYPNYLDAILNCLDSMDKAVKYSDDYSDKRYFVMKYEDFVLEPTITIKKLCEKIEVEYDKEMLNTDNFVAKSGKKWNSDSMFDEMQGISKKAINRWEENITEEELFFSHLIVPNNLYEYFDYDVVPSDIGDSKKEDLSKIISSSSLLSQGVVYNYFSGKGIERFPMNPLDPKTWADEHVR